MYRGHSRRRYVSRELLLGTCTGAVQHCRNREEGSVCQESIIIYKLVLDKSSTVVVILGYKTWQVYETARDLVSFI